MTPSPASFSFLGQLVVPAGADLPGASEAGRRDPQQPTPVVGERDHQQAMAFVLARIVPPVLLPGPAPGTDRRSAQQHDSATRLGDLLQGPPPDAGRGRPADRRPPRPIGSRWCGVFRCRRPGRRAAGHSATLPARWWRSSPRAGPATASSPRSSRMSAKRACHSPPACARICRALRRKEASPPTSETVGGGVTRLQAAPVLPRMSGKPFPYDRFPAEFQELAHGRPDGPRFATRSATTPPRARRSWCVISVQDLPRPSPDHRPWPGAQVVRRHGVTHAINKKDARFKARQG